MVLRGLQQPLTETVDLEGRPRESVRMTESAPRMDETVKPPPATARSVTAIDGAGTA